MVDEIRTQRTVTRGPESRSSPERAHSAPCELFQSLQWLRERVLERLDSLEALARQRTAAEGESAELARNLVLKKTELEETERRLCAQAERRENDWNASLSQLDADRRLLAESWELLERERIASCGASEPHHQGRGQSPGPRKSAPPAPPQSGVLATTQSATHHLDQNCPVTQAILRQFQTLCGDVRRNAEERCDSH
jgi:hypothetical protein